MRSPPLSIHVSDVHFSDRPPAARSAEPDWFAALARPWVPILRLALEHDIPVVISGDIFDHWKPSPALVNFVLDLFAGVDVYAVPGQHDLPDHRYDERHRAGYGTLERAGCIWNLEPGQPLEVAGDRLVLHGFPWGTPLRPRAPGAAGKLHVAIVHSYIWRQGHGYTDAPMDSYLNAYKAALRGYHLAVFGDNHSGFLARSRSSDIATVLNCGGLLARRQDERRYQPYFYTLHEDGEIHAHALPRAGDLWVEAAPAPAGPAAPGAGSREFIEKLENLSGDSLDFQLIVKRFLGASPPGDEVRDMILCALDPANDQHAQQQVR